MVAMDTPGHHQGTILVPILVHHLGHLGTAWAPPGHPLCTTCGPPCQTQAHHRFVNMRLTGTLNTSGLSKPPLGFEPKTFS